MSGTGWARWLSSVTSSTPPVRKQPYLLSYVLYLPVNLLLISNHLCVCLNVYVCYSVYNGE